MSKKDASTAKDNSSNISANDIDLKQLNMNLGTEEELFGFAEEVGIEPEEGQDGVELAQNVLNEVDNLGDDEWEELSENLRNWSNQINAAKKAFKEKNTKGGKSKTKSTDPATDATDPGGDKESDLEELTVAQLQTSAKSLGVVGYSKMKKPDLIKAIIKAKQKPEPEAEAGEPGQEPEAEAGESGQDATSIPDGASKGLTKKQIEARKKQASQKVQQAGDKKKQKVSEKPYKPGTSAWHVTQVVKEAGKDGITMEDAIKAFEQKVKENKLVTTSVSSRVRTIIPQAVRDKGLIVKEGNLYKPTKKLLESE